MYRKLIILLIFAVLFSACTKTQQKNSACGTQVCTALFATITIKFLDKNGNQIVVNNYTAINQRTKEVLHDNKLLAPGAYPPYYDVADDSDLKKLSADGDNIIVSGTDPATNQVKTAVIKVAGGCICHVSKISGPDSIVFD
ncbi:MAG TPA: hypothetical protein VK671_03460 [Mucilaginibacter sp.]|jgi:hypothetical protein|nr:hypothetical protein [Mucilaginibacter sp.]